VKVFSVKYAVIAMFCICFLSGLAKAQSSCDPQVMDAIESKAWLQGQRRVAQNASLVFRPDSVLEYSCFDQLLAKVAIGEGHEFSEITDYPNWGPISSNSGTSLDIAIIQTSFFPLIDYLQSNFIHTYLGGRTTAPNTPPPVYGDYNCDAMGFVWQLARCMNFMDEQDPNIIAYDGFYDFPTYALGDPRIFPPTLAACVQPAEITPSIAEAYNQQPNYYVLNTENPITFNSADTVRYEVDPIVTHIIPVIAGDCADSQIIPTGVTVERKDFNTVYEEYFCTMPSCSYDYTNQSCVR